MISLSEALAVIKATIQPNRVAEKINLTQAFGRVLSTSVLSDIDQPPFDKSAMDGYACRRADLPGPFILKNRLAAGDIQELNVAPGECVQIFTGAKVPNGADCVMMQEYVSVETNGRLRFTANETKNNICYQGEDVKRGDTLISSGSVLKAHDLAILASAGAAQVDVFRKPKIGLLCTGNELIDITEVPTGSKIRNTNLYQMLGLVQQAGGEALFYNVVEDQKEQLIRAVHSALVECDMLITTGGASVGEFDLIPEVFQMAGCTLHFSGVAIQPGKPVVFATNRGKPCWGLSGNPVSSFLQFSLMVKPSIRLLGGQTKLQANPFLTLSGKLKRKKSDRELYVPVTLQADGTIVPVDFNGSAHIAALHGCFAFAKIPASLTEVEAGIQVECILL